MISAPIIEVFTDYVCPWCYLGNNRIKKLEKNYNINVRLINFPLHPQTPSKGQTLEKLFNCSPADVKAKNAHMKQIMSAEGLEYRDRSHTYNSRLAQEIGIWAEKYMGEPSIHEKIFHAYFIYGRNIGDVEVIVDLIKSIGLNEKDAREIIKKRHYESCVDSDWEKSKSAGVTSVPTYVCNKQIVTGAQPYSVLQKLMDKVGAKKRIKK